MKQKQIFILFLLVFLNFSRIGMGGEKESHFLVGEQAPDFTIKLLDGTEARLSDFRDKKIVVLDFWTSDCSTCVDGLSKTIQVTDAFKNQDVHFIAMNQKENPETIRLFLKEHSLHCLVGLDSGEAKDLFTVNYIPQAVLIDKKGVIQVVHLGFKNLENKLQNELTTLVEGKTLFDPNAEKSESQKAAIHFYKGKIKYNTKDYDGAIQEFEESLKWDLNYKYIYAWLASAYYCKGLWDKAIQAYQMSIELYHKDYKDSGMYLLQGLVSIYIKTGRLEEAIQCLEKYTDLFQGKADYHYLYGYVYFYQMNWDTGIASLNQALKIDSNHKNSVYLLSNIFMRKSKWDEALKLCEQFLEKNPKSSQIKVSLGFVFLHKGKFKEAEAIFEQEISLKLDPWAYIGMARIHSESNLEKSKDFLNEALKISPNDLNVYMQLAWAYLWWGHLNKAMEYCQKALDVNPKRFEALTTKGFVQLNQGNYPEAKNIFQEQFRLDTQDIYTLYGLGSIYILEGEYDKAIQFYRNAQKQHSEDPWINSYLATALCQVGRYEEALTELKKSLSTHFNRDWVHTALSSVYLCTGDFEKSILEAEKAIELNPNSFSGYVCLGRVLERKKEWDKALQSYEKAIAINPRSLSSYASLGFFYIQKGNDDKAIENIQKVLSVNPKDPEALILLGLAQITQGQQEEGRSACQKVLAMNPHHSSALTFLGYSYFLEKNYTLALEHCQKALAVNPQYDYALLCMGLIQEELNNPEETKEYFKKAEAFGLKKIEGKRTLF
jgi:tetratricopeptide (TPR) repeat protein